MEIFKKIVFFLLLLNLNAIGAIFDFPESNQKISQSDLNKLEAINTNVLADIDRLGSNSFHQEERFENNLLKANIVVQNGTLSHAQLLETLPNKEVQSIQHVATKVLKCGIHFLNRYCLPENISPEDCEQYLSEKSLTVGKLFDECQQAANVSSQNGLHAFRRLLPAKYKDGFYEMNVDPKPSKISIIGLHNSSKSLDYGNSEEDADNSLALIQWTQFIEHDVVKSVVTLMSNGNPIECCNADFYNLSPRHRHSACAPIEGVTPSRSTFDRVSCLNYVRSALAVDPQCKFGSADQLNQASSILDLSQLYGFNSLSQKTMRSFQGGKLLTSNKNFLPLTEEKNKFCAFSKNSVKPCYMAGDSRVNTNPYMIILYTLFLRNHNQLADKLATLNPKWKDNKIYNEAKHINIQMYRNIVYNEWLPAVIGKENVDKIMKEEANEKLQLKEPQISNEFGVAAIRFYYSMMPNVLRSNFSNEINSEEKNKVSEELFDIKDEFYKPANLISTKNKFDEALHAVLNQKALKMDSCYAESIIKRYLTTNDSKKKISGSDALAWDIQRGRDHGIQGYTKYLEACYTENIKNWNDLLKYIKQEDLEKLKSVYDDVDDIDLIIGGISEIPKNDSTVGPTFNCIISEQFSKIRQWQSTQRVRTGPESNVVCNGAALVCKTTDILSVPKNIFLTPSTSNPLVTCAEVLQRSNICFE